jgi:tetratricopeptide (TPR) repeat protein
MFGRAPDQFDVYRVAADEASASGNVVEAEKQWLAALEIAEGDEDDSIRLTLALENLAEIFWYQTKFELAAPILRRLLRLYEKHLGRNHFDVGIVSNNMAMLYHAWGKHLEAEPFYKRALEIKEPVLGAGHPEIVLILGNYKDLLCVLKRDDEARKLDAYAQRLKTDDWRRSGATGNGLNERVVGSLES